MRAFAFLCLLICFATVNAQNDSLNKYNAQGQKNGKWVDTTKWRGYLIQATGYYKNNLKSGEWRAYFDDGSLHAIHTYDKNGKPDGIAKYFYKTGELLYVFVYKHDTTLYSADFMKDGKLLQEFYWGLNFVYDKNLCVSKDCEILNGINLSSLKTKGFNKLNTKGQKTGKWIERDIHDGDSLTSIRFYKNGLPSGEWRTYYDSGALEGIHTFDENGNKDGIAKFFYKSGGLQFVFVFDRGSPIYSVQYVPGSGEIFQEHYGGSFYMYEKGKCTGGNCKKLMLHN